MEYVKTFNNFGKAMAFYKQCYGSEFKKISNSYYVVRWYR